MDDGIDTGEIVRQYVLDPQAGEYRISTEVTEEIMEFFAVVPPFYTDGVREELVIGGAWREFLYSTRTEQIHAIDTRDVAGYNDLLNDMFRNVSE